MHGLVALRALAAPYPVPNRQQLLVMSSLFAFVAMPPAGLAVTSGPDRVGTRGPGAIASPAPRCPAKLYC
jgi:hypothetical protein